MVSLETLNKRIQELEEKQNENTINKFNTITNTSNKTIKTNNANKQTTKRNRKTNKESLLENDKLYLKTLSDKLNKLSQSSTINSTANIDLKDCIGNAFYDMHCDIRENKHTYYNLAGGRGSLKSSVISIEIVLGMMNDKNANAVIYRKVGDTLATSVYEQILWAIEKLGVEEDWKCTKSPLMCIYKPYNTRILFKGLDKARKSKSMKFSRGYAKYLWFEEFDEFAGPEEIRSVQQSVLRGGDKFFVFRSMNPPKSKSNWANDFMETESLREDTYTSHTTYLQAPKEWLGQQFIDDAEWLKETNEKAYRHEYLGEMIGTGADVFDNIVSMRISQDDCNSYANIYMGVDWGWFPDPYRWVKCNYDANRRILTIFDEYSCNKKVNSETAKILKEEKGVKSTDIITCDSAEHKSTGDYRMFGLKGARDAEKGPNSVHLGIKWLQGLSAIQIDPIRCPKTYDEFYHYELELDKDGEPIDQAYPDANNHSIDAVRYAMERVSMRRGM